MQIYLDSWIKIDQLDVICFIISLFTAQHVTDVSTSIWFDVCWCYTPTHIEPDQYNTWNKSTISRKLLKMDTLTFVTCWAVNSEIIKQVTSSWSIFIQLPSKCLEPISLWHCFISQNTWILSSSNCILPRSDPIQARTILSDLQMKCVFTIPLFQYDHRLYFGCAASIFALSHCYSQRTYEMTHRLLKLCWRYFN